MDNDVLEDLKEQINVLEFKLELVLKFAKVDTCLSLNECKSMAELAFILNFNKEQFNEINDMVTTQINFCNLSSSKTYLNVRQFTTIDSNIDVFKALSKEDYETFIWTTVPSTKGNSDVCAKIAKLNGIYDIYYGEFANEIKKEKISRLDKQEKLLNIYKEYKDEIVKIYKEIDSMLGELKANETHINDIINFFKKNSLQKISIFYNSELWERAEDDKFVVINDDSFIHRVCTVKEKTILNTISGLLKDKSNVYKEFLIYLLKSGPVSSKNIENLLLFYQTLDQFNQNDFINLEDLIHLNDILQTKITIVEEILAAYRDYTENLNQEKY